MSEAKHSYRPPQQAAANTVPDELARYLNGEDLLSKTQALRLSTIDGEGWPHAALLSAGEILVLPNGRIRFAIFPNSVTAANLARDGRLTATLSFGGGMHELRMHARRLTHAAAGVPLAFF